MVLSRGGFIFETYLAAEPLSDDVQTIFTSQPIHLQALQFLEMERFRNPTYPEVAEFVDQASFYFMDATNSNWRSAGLLYYYAFLNLAKGALLNSSILKPDLLYSGKQYHGLHVPEQKPNELKDLQIGIHPSQDGSINTFAAYYQLLTKNKWPFERRITLSVAQVLPWSYETTDELMKLWRMPVQVCEVMSLLRTAGTMAWFEMAVLDGAHVISRHLPDWGVFENANIVPRDRKIWADSHHSSVTSFSNFAIIRSPVQDFDPKTSNGTDVARNFAVKALAGLAVPSIYHNDVRPTWVFASPLKIEDKNLPWHPMLSDYLVAFALSWCLRYQPQIFRQGSADYLYAEAWARQNALATLRYFVLHWGVGLIRFGHRS